MLGQPNEPLRLEESLAFALPRGYRRYDQTRRFRARRRSTRDQARFRHACPATHGARPGCHGRTSEGHRPPESYSSCRCNRQRRDRLRYDRTPEDDSSVDRRITAIRPISCATGRRWSFGWPFPSTQQWSATTDSPLQIPFQQHVYLGTVAGYGLLCYQLIPAAGTHSVQEQQLDSKFHEEKQRQPSEYQELCLVGPVLARFCCQLSSYETAKPLPCLVLVGCPSRPRWPGRRATRLIGAAFSGTNAGKGSITTATTAAQGPPKDTSDTRRHHARDVPRVVFCDGKSERARQRTQASRP